MLTAKRTMRLIQATGAFPAMCMVLLTVASAKAQELPEGKEFPSYTVTRTTATIDIDGKLDDADWKRAQEFLMPDAYTGGVTPQKSTFRMVWDDSYLYLGVFFEDDDARGTYTEEDDPLWEEEVLEFFIDPDGDANTYYEYEINPVNAKVDLFLHRSREVVDAWRDWDFKNIVSAVHVEGGWQKRRDRG